MAEIIDVELVGVFRTRTIEGAPEWAGAAVLVEPLGDRWRLTVLIRTDDPEVEEDHDDLIDAIRARVDRLVTGHGHGDEWTRRPDGYQLLMRLAEVPLLEVT